MRKILRTCAAAAVVALSLAACGRSGAPTTNPKDGEVHISVQPDSSGRVAFTVRATTISVSWGDSGAEEHTLSGARRTLEHTYAAGAESRVSITLHAAGLTYFCPESHPTGAAGRWRIAFGACGLTAFESYCDHALLDFSCCPLLALLPEVMVVDSLNLAGCAALQAVQTYGCSWLNVRGCTALEQLIVSNGALTALDVRTCPALKVLRVNGGCDYSYDDDAGSTTCYGLTALDVSRNAKLEELSCFGNLLTTLDVSRNAALRWMECSNNRLTSLHVEGATALTALGCFGNRLTALNLSRNAALQSLDCSGNRLTTLNLSRNAALRWLYCADNRLTALHVSDSADLLWLSCAGNRLAGAE